MDIDTGVCVVLSCSVVPIGNIAIQPAIGAEAHVQPSRAVLTRALK